MLGTGMEIINLERLLSASTDALFMTGMNPDVIKIADDIQAKTKIPILLFHTSDYVTNTDKVDETLRMIGNVLEFKDRADEVIKYFRDIEKDLNERVKYVPDEGKPTVYVRGISYNRYHGLDVTDLTYLSFAVLHAKNVAAEMIDDVLAESGYAKVSKEKIIEWNPDIIFTDL